MFEFQNYRIFNIETAVHNTIHAVGWYLKESWFQQRFNVYNLFLALEDWQLCMFQIDIKIRYLWRPLHHGFSSMLISDEHSNSSFWTFLSGILLWAEMNKDHSPTKQLQGGDTPTVTSVLFWPIRRACQFSGCVGALPFSSTVRVMSVPAIGELLGPEK